MTAPIVTRMGVTVSDPDHMQDLYDRAMQKLSLPFMQHTKGSLWERIAEGKKR